MQALRENLEHRGFGVEETTDGKGAPELIRRRRPDCVVLAVDLDAGQNGYIICKKLKSEAELKSVPVIIIGDPKGFEKHQQLKTRAEDYVGKPFEAPTLVEHVGGLVGFPPPPVELSSEPANDALEEINLETPVEEETVGLDSDFEMVDSIFEDRASPPVAMPPPPIEEEIPFTTDSGEAHEDDSDKTVVGMPPPAPSLRSYQSSLSGVMDQADARELRSRNTELEGALEEARSHSAELEGRLRDLELEMETIKTEVEAAKNTSTRSDAKEVFSLRDAANKKEKEVLRLKNELNAKEQEIIELRDKENSLEQQASESSAELAKRDAQLKTLQARADQQVNEKKRLEQQLLQSREEARASAARLSTLQTDFDADHAHLIEIEAQLEPARQAQLDAENARVRTEADLTEARAELETLRARAEEQSQAFEQLGVQHEQSHAELESARTQLASQASSFADEISGLRARVANTDADLSKHERRATRLSERIKARDDQLATLRAALQGALQSIDETTSESEIGLEELADS